MTESKKILDQYFLEMRWRCLSLAADLDRVQRGDNSSAVLGADPRLARLRQALQVLLDTPTPNRAEKVQMIFSDMTPPPTR